MIWERGGRVGETGWEAGNRSALAPRPLSSSPLSPDLQIPPKVARVEPRDGQPVPVPGEDGGAIAAVAVGRHVGQRGARRRVEIGPNPRQPRPGNPSTLIRHLERDVFIPLGHDEPHRGRVAVGLLKAVVDRAKRVFDELEEHVVQVGRDVGTAGGVGGGGGGWRVEHAPRPPRLPSLRPSSSREIGVPVHVHRGRPAILARAHRARVVDRVARDAHGGAARRDESNEPLPRRLVQRDVLADEDADADAGQVEAVQELKGSRRGGKGEVGAAKPRSPAATTPPTTPTW